jgi:hypothetical protein
MQAMAVLMDHVQSIILALRAKQNFIVLVDGTEVQKKKHDKAKKKKKLCN